jgi:hypothetical protein
VKHRIDQEMGKKQKVAAEPEDDYQEAERKFRQAKREKEQAALAKSIANEDALTIGLAELQEKQRQEREMEDQDQDEGFLVLLVNFILQRKKSPLPIWRTHRRQEIEQYLSKTMRGFLGHVIPSEAFWYYCVARKKMKYWGSRDKEGTREGRGICLWPDPPKGGGGASS